MAPPVWAALSAAHSVRGADKIHSKIKQQSCSPYSGRHWTNSSQDEHTVFLKCSWGQNTVCRSSFPVMTEEKKGKLRWFAKPRCHFEGLGQWNDHLCFKHIEKTAWKPVALEIRPTAGGLQKPLGASGLQSSGTISWMWVRLLRPCRNYPCLIGYLNSILYSILAFAAVVSKLSILRSCFWGEDFHRIRYKAFQMYCPYLNKLERPGARGFSLFRTGCVILMCSWD